MNWLKRTYRAWTGITTLQLEKEHLRSDRVVAVDALKKIALGSINAADIADEALKDLGLTPIVVDVNCPPDVIYMMPKGWGKPTDYV